MLASMLYPDRLPFGGTRGLPPVSVSHVNQSIVYVAIGCVVLVLGIVLGRTVVTGGRRRCPGTSTGHRAVPHRRGVDRSDGHRACGRAAVRNLLDGPR